MTKAKLNHFRKKLEELGRRLVGASRRLEEETLRATGGESAGSLSNAPMHLGDVGTETFTHELNSTLLENEEFIGQEVGAALTRLEKGAFGVCEECRQEIPSERLEVLPYARYCVHCTEKLNAGGDANMNAGRPTSWGSTFDHPNSTARQKRADEPSTPSRFDDDSHAAGTPGGGSALGGLAGTNVGDGEPGDEHLEDAMGSGEFDVGDQGDEAEPNDAYSGPSGGAVGGSPANKRATGGRGRKARQGDH